ncbi:TetR/AcrR family transcriptional regulator [Bordetella parapertussis]|uniref:TetR/AcrR family transcriptional regulator n=1 Tax=Bordetella parapertussis TaxID=519 RepID=UPI0013E8AB38|nr:TetR/AcrR family transcriptional regulator [Bordetella parapertussis]
MHPVRTTLPADAVLLTSELENWVGIDYDDMPAVQRKLLDAAAKAFTTYGFAATSIDVIASQIGATKGSVYYHYRSKTDLFFAVHKCAMVMNLKAQVPVAFDASLDPRAKLYRMAYLHAMLMMDSLYYQRVTVQGVELHQSVSTTPMEREALAEVIAMRDVYEGLFSQVVRDGMASGHFAEADHSIAAKGILGILNWITVWYRPRETESPGFRQRVATQLATQAIQGIARADTRG